MRIIKDKEFEKEAYELLKKHFDEVIWASEKRVSPYDFLCKLGEDYLKADAKCSTKPTIGVNQKDIDFILWKNSTDNQIKFIFQEDFPMLCRQEKNSLIKISNNTKLELDKLKQHRRESYDDVIMKLLSNKKQHT